MNTADTLKSAALYFAVVFGAGFLLALIRIPWLVPRFGARVAELVELPIMLIVIFFTARWIVQRRFSPTRTERLIVGGIALVLLLIVEFSVVLWLQGLSIRETITNRDLVSGAAYALSLLVFALMPSFVARSADTTPI
jgi:hypothetical protein